MPSIPREHRKGQFLALPFARFPDTKRMQYNTKRHARTRVDPYQRPAKVFLLSPALLTGARAKQLLSPRAQFPAAQSFRSSQGVPIADAFSFLSCLYFRGKMAYAKHFASPPLGWTGTGIYVITPGFGLVPPEWTWLYALNPLTGIIDGFRAALLHQPFPWRALGTSVVVTLGILAASLHAFGHMEDSFADVV